MNDGYPQDKAEMPAQLNRAGTRLDRPKKSPRISMAMDVQSDAIAMLRKDIEEMTIKLESFMRPSDPASETNEKAIPSPIMSPMAETLGTNTARINSVSRLVRDVISRLEI